MSLMEIEAKRRNQKEQVSLKYKLKMELENLVHENIMKEMEFMAKNKITSFSRKK